MAAKLEDIRKLIAEGYVLDEVESDEDRLQARFRRGSRTVTFLFHRRDARDILLTKPMRLEMR